MKVAPLFTLNFCYLYTQIYFSFCTVNVFFISNFIISRFAKIFQLFLSHTDKFNREFDVSNVEKTQNFTISRWPNAWPIHYFLYSTFIWSESSLFYFNSCSVFTNVFNFLDQIAMGPIREKNHWIFFLFRRRLYHHFHKTKSFGQHKLNRWRNVFIEEFLCFMTLWKCMIKNKNRIFNFSITDINSTACSVDF